MKVTPSLVAVRKIQAQEPRSLFDAAAIEEAAHLILKAGALALPLIVRREGVDGYSLVEGAFGYHAAMRARELDLLEGEEVLAFIVDAQSEAIFRQQSLCLSPSSKKNVAGSEGPPLGPRLTSMEQRMEQLFSGVGQALSQGQSDLIKAFSRLEQHIPKQLPALERFNKDSEQELFRRLTQAKIPKKSVSLLAKNIVKARAERPFTSLKDMENRKIGLTAGRLLTLEELWNDAPFSPIAAQSPERRMTIN